jgi:hypothetical protein
MGLHRVEKCIFTDLPVSYYEQGEMRDAVEYVLDMKTYGILFRLPYESIKWGNENGFFKGNKHIFRGLILNNDWFEDQTNTFITIEKLKELLTQKTYPKTPLEKADLLFQFYLKSQKEDGQIVNLDFEYLSQIAWKQLFFKSYDELVYYSRHLNKIELLELEIFDHYGYIELRKFSITVKGLNYGIQLQSEGDKSNLCFIAMTFNDDIKIIRTAIKEALWETGFEPILIDEQNINSDKTINDEIIANLKKCKFCIADFSYHSNGVYFESGFALGQGKKVIYTCYDKEFAKAHFDIRPLQHIIYPSAEQLKKDLINKIEAWIK